jgi:hypothetical protein
LPHCWTAFSVLGVYAWRPGHIRGGSRCPAGEAEVLRTSACLEDHLAPATSSDAHYVLNSMRDTAGSREGGVVVAVADSGR